MVNLDELRRTANDAVDDGYFVVPIDPAVVLALLDLLAAAEALLRGTQGWLEACATIADDEDDAAALVDLDARIAAHLAGKDGVK